MKTGKPEWWAYVATQDRMKLGLQKHTAGAWKEEPVAMHIGKGIRHATTALMLYLHVIEPKDGEGIFDHLEAAICRLAMALTVLRD